MGTRPTPSKRILDYITEMWSKLKAMASPDVRQLQALDAAKNIWQDMYNAEVARVKGDGNAQNIGESSAEPKPVGRGVFGDIYDQFKGKAKEAFNFLISRKSVDLTGVFHRDEIGDIDLVWGDKSGGLEHILDKHVGDGKSFATTEDSVDAIDDIIKNGAIGYNTADKVVFRKGSKLVTIRKNVRDKGKKIADKNWVLTAYDEEAADGNTSAIASTNQVQAAPDTANPDAKIVKVSETAKASGGKVSESSKGDEKVLGFDRAEVAKEAEKAVKKVGIYDFVLRDKNDLRKALKGVFHDRGYLVGSDSHVIVSMKGKYPDNLEGEITDKKGAIVDAKANKSGVKYPKWEYVLPKFDESQLAPESVDNIIEAAIYAEKLNKILGEDVVAVALSNGKMFRSGNLLKAATMAKKLGYHIITIFPDKDQPLIFRKTRNEKEFVGSMPTNYNGETLHINSNDMTLQGREWSETQKLKLPKNEQEKAMFDNVLNQLLKSWGKDKFSDAYGLNNNWDKYPPKYKNFFNSDLLKEIASKGKPEAIQYIKSLMEQNVPLGIAANDVVNKPSARTRKMVEAGKAQDNNRYSVLDEDAAMVADRAEGTTMRMDNLKVAKEMEKQWKQLQGSDEHRRMVDASKRVRELEPIKVEPHNLNRYEQKAKYVGFGDVTNKETGLTARFFGSAFDKNYREGGIFAKAVPQLKKAFETSVFAYSEPENRAGTARPDGTIHKKHPNISEIQNYVGKLNIDGKDYYVRFTVQMQPGQNGIHSQFVSNVELYDAENPITSLSYRDSSLPARGTYDGIVDTKLRNFFDMASENEQDFAQRIKLATGWERGKGGEWQYDEGHIGNNDARASGTRFSVADEARDAEYAQAVKDGDMEKAQKLLQEEAACKGYSQDSDYQGTSAFNGSAPCGNGYYETEAEMHKALANDEFEGDISLALNFDKDAKGLDERIDARALAREQRGNDVYSRARVESIKALRKAREEYKNGNKNATIKMYRSVPTGVNETAFRNGDWITPSRIYAEDNADIHANYKGEGVVGWDKNGRRNIIEMEVPIKDVWWDGNDINEFGYDDGKDYAYKNTANNRKLFVVTYDENGNLIPLSKRFNDGNEDIRFSVSSEEEKERSSERGRTQSQTATSSEDLNQTGTVRLSRYAVAQSDLIAKLRNNFYTAKKKLKSFAKDGYKLTSMAKDATNLVRRLADSIGLRKDPNNSNSFYNDFAIETANGKFRLSNHPANGDLMSRGDFDQRISVFIYDKKGEHKNDGTKPWKEFVFYPDTMSKEEIAKIEAENKGIKVNTASQDEITKSVALMLDDMLEGRTAQDRSGKAIERGYNSEAEMTEKLASGYANSSGTRFSVADEAVKSGVEHLIPGERAALDAMGRMHDTVQGRFNTTLSGQSQC